MTAHQIYSTYTPTPRNDTGALLLRAAVRRCAMIGCPIPDLTVARHAGGKPYFPAAPWLHFSISHSGAWWVCAFSDAPVGVDLQRVQPALETSIARRFFHPDEGAWLAGNPTGFFQLWTAKEACVKLTGQGIDGNFSKFSVVRDGGIVSPIEGTVLRYLPFAEGYVLCLCSAPGEAAMEQL